MAAAALLLITGTGPLDVRANGVPAELDLADCWRMTGGAFGCWKDDDCWRTGPEPLAGRSRGSLLAESCWLAVLARCLALWMAGSCWLAMAMMCLSGDGEFRLALPAVAGNVWRQETDGGN